MGRLGRSFVFIVSLAGLLGLPVMTPAFAAPPEVQGLEDGIAELSDWLGSLGDEAGFDEDLPLLDGTVGESLDLLNALDQSLHDPVVASDAVDVAAFASAIDGFDDTSVTVGEAPDTFEVAATFATTDVDGDTGGDGVVGFQLTATISRQDATIPVEITAPASGGAPEVTLESTPSAGLPVDLSFTATFDVHYDVDTDYFYVDAGVGEPSFSATAQASGATFGSGFSTRIGIGDIEIESSSSFTLNATFTGTVSDPNGDGKLAFEEPATPGPLADAELRLPQDQIVTIARGGSVSATLNLESPLIDGTEDATLSASSADLTGPDPVPTITGTSVAEMALFGNVQPVDLIGGLVQYTTLLRAYQTNRNFDLELPFIKGRLSDVVHVEETLSAFVDDRVQDLEPGAEVTDPDELVDFGTIGELVDLLETDVDELLDTNGGTDGKVTPTYDANDNMLTLQLGMEKALESTFGPLPPPADPSIVSDVGLTDIGSELHGFTGLAGVAPGQLDTDGTPPPAPTPSPERKTAFHFEMPFLVNLSDSTPDTDDPATEGVVEFEDPMVFERFEVDTSNAGPELSLTGIVREDSLVANGTIGFVGVELTTGGGGTPYKLDRVSDSSPMVTADLDSTRASLGDTPRIGLLLAAMSNGTETTDDDPVAPATRNAKVDVGLEITAPGPEGESYFLTADPGLITIAWPNINTPLASGDVTLDAEAQLLKALDIVPPDPLTLPEGNPSALLGKVLDTLDNVAGLVGGIPDSESVLNTDLPLVGKSAADLFEAAEEIDGAIEAIRTGPAPITLQQLETTIQDELGINAGALRFSVKDVISGGQPELIIRLHAGDSFDESRPLTIDLGFGQIVGAEGSGTVDVSGSADVDLNIPITLTAPSPADLTNTNPMILNSSGLSLDFEATGGGNVSLSANLGPLEASLGPNPDHVGPAGQFAIGGSFTAFAGTDGAPVDENDEAPMSFSDFLSDLTPKLDPGDPDNSGADFDCSPTNTEGGSSPASPPSVVGEVGCLAMPLSITGVDLGTDPDGRYVTVDIDDADDNYIPEVAADGPDTLTIDDLLAALPNFLSMDDGIAKLRAILELALIGATYGAELPLIGDQIAAGAEVIENVQQLLENPLGSLPGLPGDLTDVRVDWVFANIRDNIYDGLCPSGSSGCLLRDSGYGAVGTDYPADTDAVASETDIRVVLLCGGDKHVCTLDDPDTTDADDDPDAGDVPGDENEAELLTELREVTFEFEMGQGSRNPAMGDCTSSGDGATPCPDAKDIPLDFALPGLNLSVDGDLEAKAGWSLQLGFGVSDEEGFFLLDNPMPSTGTEDAGDTDAELKVGFGAGLKPVDGDNDLEGTLGFLDIGIEDQAGSDTHKSQINASFMSNIADADGRITLAELVGLDAGPALNPQFQAEADVDIQATTGVTTSLTGEQVGDKLPRLRGNLLMNWAFGGPSGTGGGDPECGSIAGGGGPVSLDDIGLPEVCLTDLGIDPGTLFSNTFNPIFGGIKKFFEPVRPIREFLFAPIPVISDLARLFGGGDVTFVDLAEIFGDVDLSLLEDIDAFLVFLDHLPTGVGDYIILGDLNLNGDRAIAGATTPDQIGSLFDGSPLFESDITDGILDNLEDGGSTGIGGLNDLKAGGSGDDDPDIQIPILDDPSCVFGMLFGSDCTLLEYEPDPFEIRFDYEQAFGPFFGVLYVTVGGFASAGGRISLGFDTRGIRELFAGSVSDAEDVLGSIGKLLNGVFLNDLDDDGSDPNELEVSAGITAGAKLSVVVAEAGARGGIEATMGLNLHDGPEVDGKLRINEIISKIAVPFCLFDVTGRLEAFLEVYLTLGVCPFCSEYSYELARIVLLDFSASCPESPPILVDDTGDDIYLNVGTRASLRGTGWGNAELGDDESFVVRQLGPPDDDGTADFSITAFGYTQDATGKRIVIENAADGDDSFLFQGLKAGGSAGDDPVGSPGTEARFTAPVVGNLGGDNDSIQTGDGIDHIDGGSGNDTINVGEGDDGSNAGSDPPGSLSRGVSGGDNDDTIVGSLGGDVLYGNAGNDTIDAGVGGDFADGGEGNDQIDGGRDVIVVPGTSTPCGTEPCDKLDSGDTLVGGPGRDRIDGGRGGDSIYGDEGTLNNDNDGADPPAGDIDGDGDPSNNNADVIIGGLGDDLVFAGGSGDEVTGGNTADAEVDESRDRLHGNGGPDQIDGGLGNDNIWGGSGDDTLRGQEGPDNVFGQDDQDHIFGDVGDDDAYGGNGADEIFGGAEEDDLVGGPGEDDIFGGTEADVLMGDDGTIDDGDVSDDPGSSTDENDASKTETPSETTGDGDDMFGDLGDDRMFGEGGQDEMHGGSNVDFMHGNGDVDTMFGDNQNDEMYGDAEDDVMYGGPNEDLMFGNSHQDTMYGQTGADRMIGGSSASTADDDGDAGTLGANTGDTMYGGSENDRLIGDNGTINTISLGTTGLTGTFGDDTMDGGEGQDVMHGQEGDDLMYGDDAYDQMFGDLGGDTMHGEDGPDYMLGDEGTITPSTDPVAIWPTNAPSDEGAPNNDVSLDDPTDLSLDPDSDGGVDFMFGGDEDDHMYGGAANDEMSGGWADDFMEGNAGIDSMWGVSEEADDGDADPMDVLDALSDGQDDMIGGSSHVNPETIKDDDGETVMMGNGERDVMTGDNSVITRQVDPEDSTEWAVDAVTLGAARLVELLDTEKTGTDLDPVSGGDLMLGNDQKDRMFGEGGNDRMKGNNDEDYLEGNQGRDWVEGNDGQDDVVGGSAVEGQDDDGDYLWGGADADVVMGDNALITRLLGVAPVDGFSPIILSGPYRFQTNRLEIPSQREIQVHDTESFNPPYSGDDQVSGGQGSDVLFGQDEGDFLSGGSENDYMEGNGDVDFLWGDTLLSDVGTPPQLPGGIPPPVGGQPGAASGLDQLEGVQGPNGQDDQIGGSSLAGHRDQGDFLFGDGAADFQLGDNGTLLRTIAGTAYTTYVDANVTTIVRQANRFDVDTPDASLYGDDYFEGNDGDDYQWGQDGDDEMHGNADNDDMYGELDDDFMFGEGGEDAMLGDRGSIVDDLIEVDDPDDPDQFTISLTQPPSITFTGFRPGTLHRTFDLYDDGDGDPQESLGHNVGGNDYMRGGPDHDSMHGADGDDLMNGDDWGDILYGDDGSDVMWGGRGNPDPNGDPADRGLNDQWVDYVFGGHGGDPSSDVGIVTGGADILDFRPRPGPDPNDPLTGAIDPVEWFQITSTDDDDGTPASIVNNNHHQGIDWMYGGWDRDVMQGDVTANGPNDGDRMLDWDGAYNLYTACNPAYGGHNDVRALSPAMLNFLEVFAWATGAGTSHANVEDPTSSAYQEVAIVYQKDLRFNSGKAYPTTPGHFDQISCVP
jgi:Ca2+-binding RTX toxin-like protein